MSAREEAEREDDYAFVARTQLYTSGRSTAIPAGGVRVFLSPNPTSAAVPAAAGLGGWAW